MPTIEPAGGLVAESATLSPLTFVSGQPVLAEDPGRVVNGAHAATCTTTIVHYCGGFAAHAEWLADASHQPSGDKILFDAAVNTWTQRYGPNKIKIGKNVRTLRFLARCLFAAAETGEVRVMINGTQRALLQFDDGDNGDALRAGVGGAAASIAVATLGGPGYYTVTVEIRRTAGASTTNQLIMWSLDGESRDVTTLSAPSG